jgi:hypothetical protein
MCILKVSEPDYTYSQVRKPTVFFTLNTLLVFGVANNTPIVATHALWIRTDSAARCTSRAQSICVRSCCNDAVTCFITVVRAATISKANNKFLSIKLESGQIN